MTGPEKWLFLTRYQSFRLVAALGTVALLLMVLRGVLLGGPFPWADLGNGVFLALLLMLSSVKPTWLKLLYWLGLVSFFVNALDGLGAVGSVPISPMHILLPLLLLYGGLLGDLWVTLAAMVGVGGIYAFTWMQYDAWTRQELLLLTNLVGVTLLSGVAALGIWLRHGRLVRTLTVQGDDLRRELDTRSRMQALVAHDIRNPLMALVQVAELGRTDLLQGMSKRVVAILDSARDLAAGTPVSLSELSVAEIWQYLDEVFAAALARKEQTLTMAGDSSLVAVTDLAILCNSVLGNFLSNAMKFSPREAAIEITAERCGDWVRIAVADSGPGLPSALLEGGPGGREYRPSPGTDGESGSGYGLRIAALCAARLGARLEVRNRERGGSVVSVLLPTRLDP